MMQSINSLNSRASLKPHKNSLKKNNIKTNVVFDFYGNENILEIYRY